MSKLRVLYFTRAMVPTPAEEAEINAIRGHGSNPMIRNSEFARADQKEDADFVSGAVPDFYADVPVFKTADGKSRAELEREAELAANAARSRAAHETDQGKLNAEAAALNGGNPFGDGATGLEQPPAPPEPPPAPEPAPAPAAAPANVPEVPPYQPPANAPPAPPPGGGWQTTGSDQ